MLNIKALYRFLACLWLIVILFITYGGMLNPALAHGPTGTSKIRVNNETVGPYNLLVATSPQPVTMGQMSVWVRVADDATDRLLRNATVTVEATPPNGGPTLTKEATHDHASNAFDYVAHLDIDDGGEWNFVVYVEDEPGKVDVTFTESVSQALNLKLLVGLGVAFVVLAVVIGIYMYRQSIAATSDV